MSSGASIAHRVRNFLGAVGLTAVASSAVGAQELLTVQAAFDASQWIASNGAIEFRVGGFPPDDAASIAVMVGGTDVSALVTHEGDIFRYLPDVIRLPTGEQEVVVYRTSPGGVWTEIGRIAIRVLDRLGFERVRYDPGLSIDNSGQVGEGHSQEQLAPARETYQDFTFRGGFESEHVRPGFTLRSQFNVAGASNREQALRFATERNAAPRLDLSDYVVRAEAGRAAISVGHVQTGTNRHLINGFASRGIAVEAGGSRLSGRLAALNGTSIVGWSNPFGVGTSDHRVLAGEIGIDAFPATPGTLHVDATFVDGSVLPLNDFNEGGIVDAETSRGYGIQFRASDPSGRIRINGGYASSEYDNVDDVTLSRGQDLVIIHEETRAARNFDFSLDVLRGLHIGGTTAASLSTTFRHERVDPLYRSVAAFVQSDLVENGFEVTASIGPVSARFDHARRNDNLDRIASILTTRTRTSQVSLAMPLGFMIGGSASPWLPQVSWSMNRVHQAGDGVPENGDFSASHVPDQVSAIHGLSAQWFQSVWQLSYRLDRSTQDNRQDGRDGADFVRTAHVVSLGLVPWRVLNLAMDGALERGVSQGVDETTETRRVGVNGTFRAASRTSLTVFASRSWSEDPFDGGADRSIRQLRLELSQGISLFRRAAGATTGQLFIRFAHQKGDLYGLAAGAVPVSWTVNTGFNLSLF